jgi:hypothetical protein
MTPLLDLLEEHKPNYFSVTECKCGCGNLMPTHLVNRGWEYLRGHKPEALRHRSISKKDTLNQGRAPKSAPVHSADKRMAITFMRLTLLQSLGNIVAARDRVNVLRLELSALQTAMPQMENQSRGLYEGIVALDPEFKDSEVDKAMTIVNTRWV